MCRVWIQRNQARSGERINTWASSKSPLSAKHRERHTKLKVTAANRHPRWRTTAVNTEPENSRQKKKKNGGQSMERRGLRRGKLRESRIAANPASTAKTRKCHQNNGKSFLCPALSRRKLSAWLPGGSCGTTPMRMNFWNIRSSTGRPEPFRAGQPWIFYGLGKSRKLKSKK